MPDPTTADARRALVRLTADYIAARLSDLAPLEGKAIRLRRDQWDAIVAALADPAAGGVGAMREEIRTALGDAHGTLQDRLLGLTNFERVIANLGAGWIISAVLLALQLPAPETEARTGGGDA